MSRINKVKREHNIKQVSRSEDLKPAKEKTVSMAKPQIQNKRQIKDTSEITEQKKSIALNTPLKATRRASIAAIRHTKTISDSSNKPEDQEAIDKLETTSRNTIADTIDVAHTTKDSVKSRIKKKRLDIKNTKDIKSGVRTINKADRTIKRSTDTSQIAAKSAAEAAKQSAITSQKIATAKKTEQQAKKSAEWIKKIVKGIIEDIRKLATALSALSAPVLLILVLAGLIAGIVSSAFGIFFAGDESGENSRILRDVVLEINQEYTDNIENIKANTAHDELTIEGYQASWPEVLSIYAVYVTTAEGATDVVHLTDDNVETLRNIFWYMNSISYTTEDVEETEQVPDLDDDGNQKTDANGNLLYIEQTVNKTVLEIIIEHLSAYDAAINYCFTDEQWAELDELLDVSNASLWSEILRGVGLGSNELVNLALSQLGNEGGEKYWKWAGLDSRCAWCALFVSWCADQTGLRDAGQIPYFSFVSDGITWYQERDKWISGSEVDSSNYDKIVYPGMLIFFDWLESGVRDGNGDHVGIVTRVENGYIYTVEGNKGDAVAEGAYPVGSLDILGFGVVG